jgi:uncharacterized protein (DUF1684 family)
MVGPAALRVATLTLVLLAVACQSAGDGRMIHVAPPEDWESEILASRQQKDDQFRRDPETPLLVEDVAGFEGLSYWPPNPQLYLVGPINVYREPEKLSVITTAGQSRPCEKIGWIEFPIDGQTLSLQVYRLLDSPDPTDYFLPFTDSTTGNETYPSGRYLDLNGPQGGPFVLDFNRAYNPWCAYGSPERYACPVTPPSNRLPVRIEAGERGYKDHDQG